MRACDSQLDCALQWQPTAFVMRCASKLGQVHMKGHNLRQRLCIEWHMHAAQPDLQAALAWNFGCCCTNCFHLLVLTQSTS